MNTNWNGSTHGGCGVTAAELFNVILVYEDQASALRGLSLYQRLVSELGIDCDFNLNVWKFAVLGLARLDEISAEQASDADLVIVCTRDESVPPAHVRSWFQRWVEMKGRNDCALVVLGEAADEWARADKQDGFFHGLARRGGVAVFPPASGAGRAATRSLGQAWFAPRQTAPVWHAMEGSRSRA
ncbi:MAG: hypothetical protein ABMA26_21705 [Limisphaerales bacterium]